MTETTWNAFFDHARHTLSVFILQSRTYSRRKVKNHPLVEGRLWSWVRLVLLFELLLDFVRHYTPSMRRILGRQ